MDASETTPEQLQFLLGIHPDQIAAKQFENAAQGGATPDGSTPQPDQVPPQQRAATEEAEPRLIAAPSARGPRPITTEPVEVPHTLSRVAPSESMVDMPPGPEPPAPEANPSLAGSEAASISPLATPTSARPITADRAREEADQAKLDEMRARGSGVSRFQQRHHILGPIVRGLDIAGSIVAPGVAAQIPGTTLNERMNEARQAGRVKEDIGIEKEHSAEANREEVDQIRRQAETDREADRQALEKVRQDAERFRESMRDIDYDKATGQFTRGGKPYTPKDIQEGAILEAQHGVQHGRYTELWLKEKRNQAPQTHITTPSAEAERQRAWHAAFVKEYGREPNAEEWQSEKFNPNAGKKDYTHERTAAESRKESELNRLEMEFNRDWSKAQDDQERDRLTEGLKANKARVQKAYEAELAQIPTGEQQPPERVTGGQPTGGATAPTPQTHVFSLKAWQAKNPKGDPKAARAAAEKKGFQVVE